MQAQHVCYALSSASCSHHSSPWQSRNSYSRHTVVIPLHFLWCSTQTMCSNVQVGSCTAFKLFLSWQNLSQEAMTGNKNLSAVQRNWFVLLLWYSCVLWSQKCAVACWCQVRHVYLVAHVSVNIGIKPDVFVTGKRQQLSKKACAADDLTSDCSSPPDLEVALEKLSSMPKADLDPPPSFSRIFQESPKAKVAAEPLSGIHPKSAQAPDIQHCDNLHLDLFRSTDIQHCDVNLHLNPFQSAQAPDIQHCDDLHLDPFQSLHAPDIQHCGDLHLNPFQPAQASDIQHCDNRHLELCQSAHAPDIQHCDNLHLDLFQSVRASDIQHCDEHHRELLQSATDNSQQLKPPACYKSCPPEGCCGSPDVQDGHRKADKLVTIKQEIGAGCHAQEMWTPAADHTVYDHSSCCFGDLCVDTVKSGASLPAALLPQRLQASGLHGRFLWGASYPIMG